MRACPRLLAAAVLAALPAGALPGPARAAPPAAIAGSDASFDAADIEFFEKQIRPLFAGRCFECHGPKVAEPKGGLRLGARADLLRGGDTGPAIVPGKPEESLLIDAVNYRGDYEMPPKSKLSAEEISALTRWVARGAAWPEESGASTTPSDKLDPFDLARRRAEHWCWRRPGKPLPPDVRGAEWVREPLDAFLVAELERKHLSPAPPAERRVVLRRLYFDLIGLPPPPDEAAAFLADRSPDALARLVDRLLSSPRLGERWARHWLDLVRYAEGRGHEFDFNVPNAHEYRDYVIRALGADLPYDRFVIEHIAGDLVQPPRLHPRDGFNESILATGFWYLGEQVHSPVDIRKDETDRIDNAVDVFGKAFLGLTVACARCHDHKFDAISTADYYALSGYLQSSSYRQVAFEAMERNRRVAADLRRLDEEFLPRVRKAVADALRPGGARAAADLLAARRILAQGALVAPSPADDQRLARWVSHLAVAKDDPSDPLHAWAVAAHDPTTSGAGRLEQVFRPLREAYRQRRAAAGTALDGATVIVDYRPPKSGDWLTDGEAFGAGPARPGDVVPSDDPRRPIARLVCRPAARREPAFADLAWSPGTEGEPGALGGWSRAGRALKTRTFTLAAGRLFYLVEGAGHAYAAVDSHTLIHGPLHGSLVRGWSDDRPGRPRWVEHNLTLYRGHRAHIVFSPQPGRDLAVLAVVEADRPPPDVEPPCASLAALVEGEAATSVERLAAGYQELLISVLDEFSAGRIPRSSDAEGRAAIADWIIRHLDLFAEADEAGRCVEPVAAPYLAARRELLAHIQRQSRTAPAIWDGTGVDERVLIRGNANTPGPIVPRRLLAALSGESAPRPARGSGRLELAHRVVDPANPLFARVMANRVWHHLFGRGIVATVDNFGVLGERPSHPELLDHLAGEFVRDGFSVKSLLRRLALSSAYGMSSRPDAAADAADPRNLLWHRRNLRRLEAEAIRDAILAVSGRLDGAMHGRPIPVFLNEFQEGRGRPASGPLDGQGRRSIYLSVRRNFLSPFMLAFDAPQPTTTVGRRNVSNVPAQALILLNDPFVRQQAETWARRLLAEAPADDRERIERMYLEAFARPAGHEEMSAALTFLARHGAGPLESPRAATGQWAVWAELCHALLNAKEFVFVP